MQIIKYMNKVGYFQSKEEYRKYMILAEKGIIPEFMQDDYEFYKERLKEKRRKNGRKSRI